MKKNELACSILSALFSVVAFVSSIMQGSGLMFLTSIVALIGAIKWYWKSKE